MTVTAKNLINSKFAAATDNTEYTTPASTRTIIDKVTATNNDGSSQTITVNIVPSGGSVATSNIITKALSIAAGATATLSELQNQILEDGDLISCKASSATKIIIRASGREIT